jgi:hypothetical protein
MDKAFGCKQLISTKLINPKYNVVSLRNTCLEKAMFSCAIGFVLPILVSLRLNNFVCLPHSIRLHTALHGQSSCLVDEDVARRVLVIHFNSFVVFIGDLVFSCQDKLSERLMRSSVGLSEYRFIYIILQERNRLGLSEEALSCSFCRPLIVRHRNFLLRNAHLRSYSHHQLI